MNKRQPVFSESELSKKYSLKSNIEGWYFSVDQVATFTWYVQAKSIYGFEISLSGSDGPDFMIEQCEIAIRKEMLEGGMYFID